MSKKVEDMYLTCFLDGRARNISTKEAFNMGYSLAEKDNALTWEDIRLIDIIGAKFAAEHGEWAYKKRHYEEILEQFLEQKGGKI